MKGTAPDSFRVHCFRLWIVVLVACALGVLFNGINPDGIPLIRSVPVKGDR